MSADSADYTDDKTTPPQTEPQAPATDSLLCAVQEAADAQASDEQILLLWDQVQTERFERAPRLSREQGLSALWTPRKAAGGGLNPGFQ